MVTKISKGYADYHKKKECDEPGWEGEWARVQRERREKLPLYFGGKCKNPDFESMVSNGGNKPLYERGTYKTKDDRHGCTN